MEEESQLKHTDELLLAQSTVTYCILDKTLPTPSHRLQNNPVKAPVFALYAAFSVRLNRQNTWDEEHPHKHRRQTLKFIEQSC